MVRDRFHQIVFLLALCIYVVTAYNSHGFYHADEHYQIIEFAGLKLGTHTPSELAWEYNAQIRPALQPTIGIVVFKMLSYVHINDPYSQVFILRLLTAIFSVLIIRYFILNTENQFENRNTKRIYYLMSYFLWFIPFLSVRFSSETWSGIFFLLAIAIFLRKESKNIIPLIIGSILGISFLFRFQIAFAIIGLILWLVLIRRVSFLFLFKLGISFVFILLIGFLIDSWYYDAYVFTPWNYFNVTILESESSFGTEPWYYYLVKLLFFPSYFIGIPLVVSFILLMLFKIKNIYMWITIPFILLHSIIPHKEERFLFPIVFLFPIILISCYTLFLVKFKNQLFISILKYILLVIFCAVNLIGIIAMSQKSAGYGRMEITKHIHDNNSNKSINLIYTNWANPYNPWNSLPMKFYQEKQITEKSINGLCELNDSLIQKNSDNYLVIRKFDLKNQECMGLLNDQHFLKVKQSIPEWIERINKFYNGLENDNILLLYKYEKEQ